MEFRPSTIEALKSVVDNKAEIAFYQALLTAFNSTDAGICSMQWMVPKRADTRCDTILFHPDYRFWVFEVKGFQIHQIVRIQDRASFVMVPSYYGPPVDHSDANSPRFAGDPLEQTRRYRNQIADSLERSTNHSKYRGQYFYYTLSAIVLPFITEAEWKMRGFDRYEELTEQIIFGDQLTPDLIKKTLGERLLSQTVAPSLRETFERISPLIIDGNSIDDIPTAPDKETYRRLEQGNRDLVPVSLAHENSHIEVDAELQKLQLAAEEGDPESQYELAVYIVDNNLANLKHHPQALELIKDSANQKNADAYYCLGRIYFHGYGVEKNLIEGFRYIKLAAENGILESYEYLADMYEQGLGTVKDKKKAFEWLTEGVKHDDPGCKYSLSFYYLSDDVVVKDPVYGIRLLEEAAEAGHEFAQEKAVARHYYGTVVEKNLDKALKWALICAERGNDPISMHMVYQILKEQSVRIREAVYWLKRAADEGCVDAQVDLAEQYRLGKDLPVCHEEAVKYYKLAADQGKIFAIYMLGKYYKAGIHVKKDFDIALKMLTVAANQGYVDAELNLGFLFRDEKFPRHNVGEAIYWFEKAGKNGDSTGFLLAAYLYFGEKMYEKAVYNFKRGAEQGHAECMRELAKLYEEGSRVPKNKRTALRLYRQAAEKGDEESKMFLENRKGNGFFSSLADLFA